MVRFSLICMEESVWIHFKTENGERVLIGCMYRSPNSTEANTEHTISLLKTNELSKFDKICIIGDFNYPNINWNGGNNNPKDTELIETIRDAFLIQMVDKPTRYREGQRANILDLVLVNDEQLISDITHMAPVAKSDHNVLYFQLYTDALENVTSETYRYNMSKGNFEKMRREFSEIDWTHLNTLEVEECWADIRDKIQHSMENNIPKVKVKKKRKLRPYWLSASLVKSVKKKYRLYKRYLETQMGTDYQRYINLRNLCNKLIKKERKNFERDIAGDCKKNPKRFWKYVQNKLKFLQVLAH